MNTSQDILKSAHICITEYIGIETAENWYTHMNMKI